MVGVEHVGGVEPQLTFSKSESEQLRMMQAEKEVTDHFHFLVFMTCSMMLTITMMVIVVIR